MPRSRGDMDVVAALVAWLVVVAVQLGFVGVIIWAIIKIVSHYTGS